MFASMDKLDGWAVAAVLAMGLYAGGLLVTASGPAPAGQYKAPGQAEQRPAANSVADSRIAVAKNLLSQDNLEKSEALVSALLKEFPYEGELFMLKGDILMRRQQPVAAMYEYKEAIQLNPDFLDKKTSQFQGRKIKNTVEEAMAAIDAGLRKDPGDSKLKDDQKTLYYMKRKLAGSCG